MKITVAHGDGIGPEIMSATLKILNASGADLEYEEIEIGKNVYEKGIKSGMKPEAMDVVRKNKVFLKAPITTPQGGGVKSLNVTIRKTLGLYANVRPCIAYAPFVKTKHSGMNVTIVRENEEDTYGGIEHQQTFEVTQCLKLITYPGTERIIRYAFEYARRNNRKKVTCFTKDNIMKITDGMFHDLFVEIAKEYPDIESDNMIIDIGTARLADTPNAFDVIVTTNLYGDIISDVAAQIAGSVGLVGSSNIGDQCSMFEAIHGSAPDIAGQNIANPSGLLMGAVMMLVHIGQTEAAQEIHNAWLKTIEDGIHTADIYDLKTSKQNVSTEQFAEAVIKRMGQKPTTFEPISYASGLGELEIPMKLSRGDNKPSKRKKRELVGVDVFTYWEPSQGSEEDLAKLLQKGEGDDLKLTMITNRGTKVWPDGYPETFVTDHWRCRFTNTGNNTLSNSDIVQLLGRLNEAGNDVIKTENLYHYDGKPGFSLGQGE